MKKLTQTQKINAIYEWVRAQQIVPTVSEFYRIGNLEIYPHDLPKTMTYVDTVKAVKKIGDGWRIPTQEELRLLYKNKDSIGGFCITPSGSGCPQWYWSCTEHRVNPSSVWSADFSDGYEGWHRKDDFRLSCRLVRLVPVAG